MGVQCQIMINKTKEGILRTGQVVKGKVRYVVDEPTECRSVSLRFIGKEECAWRQGTKTHKCCLDDEQTLLDISGTITLEDQYEQSFEFVVPVNLSQSYKDHFGSIFYIIELELFYPNCCTHSFTTEVPVLTSYLYPEEWYDLKREEFTNSTPEGSIIFGVKKELFAPFPSKPPVVHLRAEIAKIFLIAGENANISYEVTNDTDVEISSVKTELYRYTTYTSDDESKKYLEAKVESCEAETASIPKRQVSHFSCILPTLPELYSIPYSEVICVEYRVRSTVQLPIPHMNAIAELPVLISGKAAVEVPDVGEQPPTYWEAMSEVTDKSDDGRL